MAVQPWRKGVIIRVENETETTRRYWIQVPELESFDFEPGQFVTLDLPIHEKPNKRWRSYSIASWPDGTNVFELCIVLLEGGLGTTYLFNEIGVGGELTLRGPQGVFTMPETLDKDLFLICTGTGIAPFRSMLHHILRHNIPHQNLYLVFGSRYLNTTLYYEEMKQLEKDLPGFEYLPVLSREQWEGKKGYVHGVYEELVKDKSAGSPAGDSAENKSPAGDPPVEADAASVGTPAPPPPAYFYLCGWKDMIDEARARIVALGYDRKAIHLELYG
jgi:glycine betaine catabolism B